MGKMNYAHTAQGQNCHFMTYITHLNKVISQRTSWTNAIEISCGLVQKFQFAFLAAAPVLFLLLATRLLRARGDIAWE